ncbi:hypothetical protein [Pseudomonas fragi]|uniref:hypothetical protein n=1 Tax=Pseudomonas fragi TaxID=296 RepID=UPI00381CE16F
MTAHCIESTTNSIVKFEEKRSILHINNKSKRELLRHKVDGCLITVGRKCDWLLVDEVSKTEVFIELKGADVDEAVKQLCLSVDALSKKPNKKYGYVVCTRCPISSPAIQRMQKIVLKSHSLTLRIKKTIHVEDIERLI